MPPGNALEATTTSALSNNGTEKNGSNTVVGQFTTALRSNLLFEARAQYSREKRPREANEESPTVQNSVGNYGTVNFLPTTQFDWRAQAATNVTWVTGPHTDEGRRRAQPRLRRADCSASTSSAGGRSTARRLAPWR